MKKMFIAALALFMLLLAGGCAGDKTEATSDATLSDLAGFDSKTGTEAQKLYAKARVMWDFDEKCSDPELAMELLEVVIALEPEYADAYMRRALAASELGDWDSAFDDSSRAIRMDAKPDNYALRSLIFMREGNYRGARKDLERAIKLSPKNSRARVYLKNLDALEKAS